MRPHWFNELCPVFRPDYLDAARSALSAQYPPAQWPLHWQRFELSRSEQDWLRNEIKFRDKWPDLMASKTWAPPPLANAEQASSQATAWWKARHLAPAGTKRVLDLTGGSGIDTWAFEKQGAVVTCCEPDPYLAELLRFNGRERNRHVVEGPAESYVSAEDSFDLVYVDPSRRSEGGSRREVADLGLPDPVTNLEQWLRWAPAVLIKLSPMVDRRAVLRLFPTADAVVYLSRRREVKELLVRIPRTPSGSASPIWAVDVDALGNENYRWSAEDLRIPTAEPLEPGHFLHDPDPVLRAAGAESSWAHDHGMTALHPGLSLFSSTDDVRPSGGRHFAVESVHVRLPKDLRAASVVTKGFPERAEDLRRRAKLAEDSERFLFAMQYGPRGPKTFAVARRLTD